MKTFKIPFDAMACHCEIVLECTDETAAYKLAQGAIMEVQRIEYRYSRYRPDSIISQINAAAGRSFVACDDETWALLNYADHLYETSDGLFDITAGVLRQVWNFNDAQLPSKQRLAQICELISWSSVERQQQQIRLPQVGMELDFGGFGKEYAADKAAAQLTTVGVEHGYVNLGGDLRVIGPKPDGQAWMMGIQDPRDKTKLVASIPIKQGALATSGDYQRYFDIAGKRYCHILDPHTGQPVDYWRSVSVIAPLAIMAGNYSTITMLKQSAGLDFLEASNLSYLAIDHQGKIHMNSEVKHHDKC
ncbi:MAG: FAD:protein FMN transferase [Undibacterium sp.]|nr:FAD:protein FMN transferase [Undibacterium sp.]